MILIQAEEQLKTENISIEQYNNILQQVIQVGERQKIQERRTLERRQSMSERSGSRHDSVSSASSAADADERRGGLGPADTDDRERHRGDGGGGDQPMRVWDDMPPCSRGRGGWRRPVEPRASLLPLPHSMTARHPPAGYPGPSDEYHDQESRLHSSAYDGPYGPGGGGGGRSGPGPGPGPGQVSGPPGGPRGRPVPPPFEGDRGPPAYRGRARGRGGRPLPRGPPGLGHFDEFEPTSEPDLPEASADDLAQVERERAHSTSTFINEEPREIRWYGENCICLLDWDDPRMLFFKPGSRQLTLDGQQVVCRFNDTYSEVVVDGARHRIRLGNPTKEVFLDGHGYQVFFGGDPVQVVVDGRQRALSVDGPAPGVAIGRRRTDFCAGKIKMIIDGNETVPIYLDCKPQRFDVAGKPHVLRFRDGFMRMELNGHVMRTEFGGLPVPVVVGGRKHYVRLTRVPIRVKPGRMEMKGMFPNNKAPWPLPWEDREFQAPPLAGRRRDQDDEEEEGYRGPAGPGRPRPGPGQRGPPGRGGRGPPAPTWEETPDDRARNPTSSLDVITNMMPTTVTKPPTGPSYRSENPGVALAPGGGGMDINELLKKLATSGLIGAGKLPPSGKPGTTNRREEEIKNIKQIRWKSESLKIRQPGLINLLYSGIQCASCGSRFLPEQTVQYSNHLDWHFRLNRREREGTRRAQSRRWYYDQASWLQYEEVEDADDRADPAFDQPEQLEAAAEEEDPESLCSAPVGATEADNKCQVCGEQLRRFFHEESEEWHLRDCIRVEGKAYHPGCFEDHKTTLLLQSVMSHDSTDASVDVSMEDTHEYKPNPNDDDDDDDDRKPSAEDLKSAAEDLKPSTEDSKPSTEDSKPSTEERKPSTEEGKPSTEERKPSAEERKSSAEERKPSAEERKPSAEESKPSAEESKPSAEESKPSAEDASSSEDLKPSTDDLKPSEPELSADERDVKPTAAELTSADVEMKSADADLPAKDSVVAAETVSGSADDADMTPAQTNSGAANGDVTPPDVSERLADVDVKPTDDELEVGESVVLPETSSLDSREGESTLDDANLRAADDYLMAEADVKMEEGGAADDSEPEVGEDDAYHVEEVGVEAAAARLQDSDVEMTEPAAPEEAVRQQETVAEPATELWSDSSLPSDDEDSVTVPAVTFIKQEPSETGSPPPPPRSPTPLDQLEGQVEPGSQPEVEVEVEAEAEAESRRESELESRRESELESPLEAEAESRREAEAESRREAETESRPEAETESRLEAESETEVKQEPPASPSPSPQPQADRSQTPPAVSEPAPAPAPVPEEPEQTLMDGNMTVPEARRPLGGRIRLNLAGVAPEPEPETPRFSERPTPASVKPALIGRELTELPQKHSGDEESGMCAIM